MEEQLPNNGALERMVDEIVMKMTPLHPHRRAFDIIYERLSNRRPLTHAQRAQLIDIYKRIDDNE